MQWLGRGRKQLTAGSDLDQAAYGGQQGRAPDVDSGSSTDIAISGAPWPKIIDGGYKFKIAWRPNSFREVFAKVLPGNYGAISSQAGYQFKASEYVGVGLTPGPMPVGTRPTYNNLVPILWGLRVVDPKSQAQLAELTKVQVVQVAPSEFVPAGVASLAGNSEAVSGVVGNPPEVLN